MRTVFELLLSIASSSVLYEGCLPALSAETSYSATCHRIVRKRISCCITAEWFLRPIRTDSNTECEQSTNTATRPESDSTKPQHWTKHKLIPNRKHKLTLTTHHRSYSLTQHKRIACQQSYPISSSSVVHRPGAYHRSIWKRATSQSTARFVF